MTNWTIAVALLLGAAVAVLAWIAAVWVGLFPRRVESDSPDDVLRRLEHLERLKLVLIACLAVVTIGLAVVVNNLSSEIHNLRGQ